MFNRHWFAYALFGVLTVLPLSIDPVMAAPVRLIGDTTMAQSTPGVDTGDAPFTITAEPLFGGVFKLGEWLPIVATVENHGPDTFVEVRVTVGPVSGPTTFVVPVDLPAGSEKQVTVYTLPETLPRSFEVLAVETGAGRAVARTEITTDPVFQGTRVCGVAGYADGALPALAQVQVSSGMGDRRPITVAPIDLARIPDQVEGLRSFDCIVIGGNVATVDLSPDQAAALHAWVRDGGQIILATGELWHGSLSTLPDDVLPGTISDTVTLDAITLDPEQPITGPLVVARIVPEDTAEILAGDDELPMIVRRLVGRGEVIMLAFDPAATPVATWPAVNAFWSGLIQPVQSTDMYGDPAVNPRLIENSSMVGALSYLPELRLPSLVTLLALLVAYVVAISPINYLVLRRLNRLRWAWATTLGMIVVFAIAAYGLGLAVRGDHVVVNRITILKSDQQEDEPGDAGSAPVTTARTYFGVFSPSETRYELQIGDPDLTAPGGNILISPMANTIDPWSPGATTGPGGTVVQGTTPSVREFGVGRQASRLLLAEYAPVSSPGIDADLAIEGERLAGTVTNVGSHSLDDVVVFFGSSIYHLGDIPAGTTVDVDLPLESTVIDPNMGGFPLSMALLGVNPMMPWPEGDDEFTIRRLVLENVFGYTTMEAPDRPTGINVVAWSEQPSLPVRVDGDEVRAVDTQLIWLRLPLRFSGDDVRIPMGAMTPRLVASDAEMAAVTPYDIQVMGGTADFAFTVPASALPLTVTGLDIAFTNFSGVPGQALDIELFAWDTGEYEAVTVSSGRTEIPQPERFVDPERGEIRIRLTSPGFNQPIYALLNASVEGVRLAAPDEGAQRLRDEVERRWS